jgi:cytochrome c oxidase subunit 1/cytochrome c oxidase subunit I+III
VSATSITHLDEIWRTEPGFKGFFGTVDHKVIGKRYLATALLFLVMGGLEAMLMRAQLTHSNETLLSPEAYNQLFTMHGVTMMFLFVQPVLSGFSFFLTPLMVGARELAFPRLNSFSYYVFLLAGIFIYASFLIGSAPNAGWFNYTPLSGPVYDSGPNIDFYCLGLLFLGIATTAGAVNSIVSILKLRAPGMSIDRMPLFLWSSLTMSVAVVFAMPALSASLIFLELERHWHFVFFDPRFGGSPLLWQHLFWIFGHPWVYIVFLPATGMLSMVIPTFSRRSMVGHTYVALSTVMTGLVGFGVWVHHMFAIGMSQLSMSFFGAASITISIPSAIQIFAWLATMYYGRVVFRTPMLFALGFIAQFVIGGVSGVMTAAVPFDWQATDTYFVVAHLHYVLAGGTLFGVFAAIYYWYPKMFGRRLDERTGKLSFWLMFLGFNIAFFPMHVSGLLGMPRRVYTYASSGPLNDANMLSTIGAYIFAVGIVVTLWNVLRSRAVGVVAGPNPWNAGTLEWATESPPEDYNFARMPIVSGRDPLWTNTLSEGPPYDDARLTPRTTALDASLEPPLELPEDNIWTVATSITLLLLFAGLLSRAYWLAGIALAATLLGTARWMWPTQTKIAETEA